MGLAFRGMSPSVLHGPWRAQESSHLAEADLTISFYPFKIPNFQLIFHSRQFCNQVSHAKPSPLEEQTGNALMSLKSGRMGDFLDYRTKRVTIGVSEEALFSHARAKREDAKDNVPSPDGCRLCRGTFCDTECPCEHQAVPELMLWCLKQQIMQLSTVPAWDLQRATVIPLDAASSVCSHQHGKLA